MSGTLTVAAGLPDILPWAAARDAELDCGPHGFLPLRGKVWTVGGHGYLWFPELDPFHAAGLVAAAPHAVWGAWLDGDNTAGEWWGYSPATGLLEASQHLARISVPVEWLDDPAAAERLAGVRRLAALFDLTTGDWPCRPAPPDLLAAPGDGLDGPLAGAVAQGPAR